MNSELVYNIDIAVESLIKSYNGKTSDGVHHFSVEASIENTRTKNFYTMISRRHNLELNIIQGLGKNIRKIIDTELSKYARKCNYVEITNTFSKNPSDSKIGGMPYASKNTDLSQHGAFIAQINLEDLKYNPYLPKTGLLQFWSGDYDEGKVIYYPIIDKGITYKYLKSANLYKMDQDETPLRNTTAEYGKKINIYNVSTLTCYNVPDIYSDLVLSNPKIKEFINQVNKNSNQINKQYALVVEDIISFHLGECEIYSNMFGFGNDVQGEEFDNINTINEKDATDIILLQLDSDNETIVWGDWGIGRWTISKKMRKEKIFQKPNMIGPAINKKNMEIDTFLVSISIFFY